MDEGRKFIIGMVTILIVVMPIFLFFVLDYYIPSAALQAAVQGASIDQAEDRLYTLLRGCRRARIGSSHDYPRGSIGTYTRSFPSIRNDKGWLAGTKVHCSATGCDVTSSAMIPAPRESASCRMWKTFADDR